MYCVTPWFAEVVAVVRSATQNFVTLTDVTSFRKKVGPTPISYHSAPCVPSALSNLHIDFHPLSDNSFQNIKA